MAKKKKGSSLLTQAKKLGAGKYAPVLQEIEMNKATNTKLYQNAGTQRKSAIDREIGSINAAGATSKRLIGETGAGNQTMYQQAMAKSQSNTQELLSKVDQNHSSMLSSLQAEIKARGGSPEDYAYLSPLTRNADQTNGTLAAVGDISRSGFQAQALSDQSRTTSLQAMADMMATTGASKARGAAQTNFDELYTNWLGKQGELDTAHTKAKLEEGDYINQTYLTLKKEAELRKQERAQLALQQYSMGLKNAQAMAKQSSSDYFKEENLNIKKGEFGIKKEDLNLRGKALDARIAQMKRSGDHADAQLLETIRNNNAKNRREDAKAGVTYTPPKSIAKIK
jgi:hypothetical protein